MKPEDLDPKKKNDIIFANDVGILLDLLRDGRFEAIVSLDSNQGRLEEEKKLAKTFHYLRNLLFSQSSFTDEEERALNLQAQALIEALALNKRHRVWTHIDGLRALQRGHRAPTTLTLLDRALVLALVRVLKDEGSSRPVHDAVVMLEDEYDLGLTVDKVRGWGNTNDERFSSMVSEHLKGIALQAKKDDLPLVKIAVIWVGTRVARGSWNTHG